MRHNFKMIARSVGYRLGKNQVYKSQGEMPDFSHLFALEYVQEAIAGYKEGQEFMREKYAGGYKDTFYTTKLNNTSSQDIPERRSTC